jgi:hypothetical protein
MKAAVLAEVFYMRLTRDSDTTDYFIRYTYANVLFYSFSALT